MTFAYFKFLWLLAVIPPALLLFFWWSARARRKLMTQFVQARLLPDLLAGVSDSRRRRRAACLIGAVVCLILAIARPQWGYDLEGVTQRGLDIVVAIDTSKSMLAQDIAPNRLARAKLAALDLMQQAKSDRLGLVVFAGTAFLQCPLTIDDAVFRQSVDSLDVHTIPEGGTALSAAIETALRAFKEEDNIKVLVLITDGEDHDSEATEAATRTAAAGLRIFTIGIGSAEGEVLRTTGPDAVRDENGNAVKSRLNESLLQEIARIGNGYYLPLRGANTMDTLYQRCLAPLPKSESREQWIKRARERYHWPLAMAIVLLVLEMFVPERQAAGRREAGKPSLRTTEAVASMATAAVLLLFPSRLQASPESALGDYREGKYAAAQKEFERLAAADKNGGARYVFNAGDAAYRATNYDAAARLFTSALLSPDLKLQAKVYFNLGNTQFRLGEAAEDIDGVEQWWRQAITNYTKAVELDKKDSDAAHNLAFVKTNVAMIEELREAARQARVEADAFVRRRNYHRAREILELQVQRNIAAKQFDDYVKRLKDIDEIATPDQR